MFVYAVNIVTCLKVRSTGEFASRFHSSTIKWNLLIIQNDISKSSFFCCLASILHDLATQEIVVYKT
jgi:hypothetical protein